MGHIVYCNIIKETIMNFKSLPQLLDHFKEEETCIEYYAVLRWGGNPVCPHCGSENHIKQIEVINALITNVIKSLRLKPEQSLKTQKLNLEYGLLPFGWLPLIKKALAPYNWH